MSIDVILGLIFVGIILILVAVGLGYGWVVMGIILTISAITLIIVTKKTKRKKEEKKRLNEELDSFRNKIIKNQKINNFVTCSICDFCNAIKMNIYSSNKSTCYIFEAGIYFTGACFFLREKEYELNFQSNNLPDLKLLQMETFKTVILNLIDEVLRKNLSNELYSHTIIKDSDIYDSPKFKYYFKYKHYDRIDIIFNRLPNPNTRW